mgnify:CR=1 FL=1
MAYETSFDAMNKGSKGTDEMTRMDAMDIAESRRNEAMRSYAKESGPAGGANVGNAEAGPYNVGLSDETRGELPKAALENRGAMGMESGLDEDIRAKEFGIKTGELIQSELPTASVGMDLPDMITNRFEVVGHGKSMRIEPGKTPEKRKFAVIRDNVRDKEMTVTGGEQIPGLGRIRTIVDDSEMGPGIEILSEPGRGPVNFVLPFEGRNDDDLLMGMTDAGPGMGVMASLPDLTEMAVGDMGKMAASMMMGDRAYMEPPEKRMVGGLSPAQNAVLGTPLANDYLAGQELLQREMDASTDMEIDSALMGDMGFDAMDIRVAPEVGMGLRKFAEDPSRMQRPIRYSVSTMVDDERAHVYEVGNGRPGEVFIYYPERGTGRMGSIGEIGQIA